MRRFHRLMFWQVVTWLGFFTAAYMLDLWQINHGVERNNHWVFNIHLFIETGFLMMAARVYAGKGVPKTLLGVYFGLFVLSYLASLLMNGISGYAYYADATACFVLCAIYALILFQLFHQGGSWWKTPEIYMCSGIFIYYACSIPYITAFGYLQQSYPDLSRILFHLVNDVLANLRYGLLALGFWLIKNNRHE
jgi:hypothetical protein